MRALRFVGLACTAATLLFGSVQAVSAAPIIDPVNADGTWYVLDDYMDEGQFFTGDAATYPNFPVSGVGVADIADATRYEWTSLEQVRLDVVDHAVATDRYKIWIDDFTLANVYATLNGGTQWQDIAGCTPLVPTNVDGSGPGCHYTYYPATPLDAYLTDPVFASGSFLIGPGTHRLVIQALEIPNFEATYKCAACSGPGDDFPDATVAFRITPVPEPGTLLLLGSGLIAGAARLRKKRGSAPAA